jgi:hypothetical protein
MDARIPSELAGPLPRKVRATGGGAYLIFVATIFLVFAIAAGLWAVINTIQQATHREALRSNSSIAAGTVTNIRRGKSMVVVFYTFNVNGRPYVGKADAPWRLENEVERSFNALPVRYVPANPGVNHPATWEWSLFYWIPLSTDLIHLPDFSREFNWLVAALMSGVFGILLFKGVRAQRMLLVEGTPVLGVVTMCTRGSRGSYSIEYEFRTESGNMTKGRSSADRQEVGANICVLYSRSNPRRSQLYPSANYRIAE